MKKETKIKALAQLYYMACYETDKARKLFEIHPTSQNKAQLKKAYWAECWLKKEILKLNPDWVSEIEEE